MKHLILVAALVVAMQPLAAGVDRPNGATVLAAILIFVWGLCMVVSPSKR